jgi:hypothetical protein
MVLAVAIDRHLSIFKLACCYELCDRRQTRCRLRIERAIAVGLGVTFNIRFNYHFDNLLLNNFW